MPHSAILRISAETVVLTTDGGEVSHHPEPQGSPLLWKTYRSRKDLLALGRVLGERYLAGVVGEQLDSIVQLGTSLRVGLVIDESLSNTPWEALTLPNHDLPLALHPSIELYREVPGQATDSKLTGPLRILAAIGCPERSGMDLLDYEYELSHIQDAVESTRQSGLAEVRILNWGTLAAIREALDAERYHILHISCHAQPGILVLETDDGQPDRVTARRLAEEVLPRVRPPLIVLAGCSTAVARPEGLPGLAQSLLHQGVSAVLAMNAPVSDKYATDLVGAFYAELAEQPDPVKALATARRQLQEGSEWATAALFTVGQPRVLFTSTGKTASATVHKVGDLVGRRAELRLLSRSGAPKILVHGIGGVGKSTLAKQLLRGHTGHVVSLAGSVTVDQIMLAIADRLQDEAFGDGTRPWKERLASLSESVTILLDDFEDNLIDGIPSQVITDFFTAWPGKLIVTSRRPFPVPHDQWICHHLGPLSSSEARKLMWRLPMLDALPAPDRRRAVADLGGHPRSLEYLDALLSSGEARFPEVADRIERLLRERGIADPASWLAETGTGQLDRQLTETVTLAADDVLLADLLSKAYRIPLARRLLIGASVYRQTVDEVGLAAQVSDEFIGPDDEHYQTARAAAERVSTELRQLTAVARKTPGTLPPGSAASHLRMLRAHFGMMRIPASVPDEFGPAMTTLLELGLLVPVQGVSERTLYRVHRWVAREVTRLASVDELTEAHRKAADNFIHQAAYLMNALVFSRMNLARVTQQLEAVYHSVQAGNLELADALLDNACGRLQAWGYWEWERHVYGETLTMIGTSSPWAEKLLYWLANNAYERGDYDDAETRYKQLLANAERRGDNQAIASQHHELAMIAYSRDDYRTAEAMLHKVLAVGPKNARSTYSMLGIVAHEQQNYAAAERWYQMSLAISRRQKDRKGLATAFGQLGILARAREDFDTARKWQTKSLDLNKRLGDITDQARSLGELGEIATATRNHSAAADYFRRALAMFESAGNRPGVLIVYCSLAALAASMDDPTTAEHWCEKSLTLAHELGDLRRAASTFRFLVTLAGPTKPEAWVSHTLHAYFLNLRAQPPLAKDDVIMLALQRRELGAEFDRIVRHVVSSETADRLFEILDHIKLSTS